MWYPAAFRGYKLITAESAKNSESFVGQYAYEQSSLREPYKRKSRPRTAVLVKSMVVAHDPR